jgi:DNA helicase-4
LQDKLSRFVIELAKDGHTEIKIDGATMKFCPKCETGTLSQKTGRYGPFEACSAHPGCDYTKRLLSFSSNETTSAHTVRLKKPISDGARCPTCNQGTMVVRSGQNNQPFLGCSSFPRCRTTAPITDPRDAMENTNRSN